MKLKLKSKAREALAGYFFILPNFLGFLAFTSLPVLASFILSFMDWDILTPPKFVGFSNFIKLLGFHYEGGEIVANDPLFWKYVYNTIFLMAGIPIGIMSSLIAALFMNQKLRGVVFFRTIYFLPTVTSGVALCLLWKWIYSPDLGLLNSFIAQFGNVIDKIADGIVMGINAIVGLLGSYQISLPQLSFRGPEWLSSTTWAKPALMIMGLWGGLGGYNMILYLAALQGVPRELYEAAEIDGAGGWHKFWKVTWPMISPTTFFIFIMSIIGGFQGGFMAAYIMTGGGPAGATTTIEFYIYQNAYRWFEMGYAASMALFLFLVIFVVTLFNWKFGGRVVQYY